MSERQADISASFSLDPAAAARLMIALDASDTPPPDQFANQNLNIAVPSGYIIDRVVGTGGGGTVYRAFREGSDRPLALKILELRLGEGPAAQRAWRELQILGDLHLPVLPRVIDHGVHQGRLYIATEFIEGQMLDDFALTPLPPLGGMGVPPVPTSSTFSSRQVSSAKPQAALVSLLAKVADAVQLLHEHGILHRDLKPSNIIIDTHGEPILIDLGIASIVDTGGAGFQPAYPTLTEDGRPIGTPAFMAPEQARGERQRISTRSDVYSLGATAYKVLTGTTPHDTNTTIHEAIRRVAQDEPRDPRALEPSLPKPLAAVLSKACSREPSRRYASAAEFAADLRRWINGEPVEAVPPGVWQRAVRWAGKNPVKVTTAFCAAMVILTLSGLRAGVWWSNETPSRITISTDRAEATLIARNGRTLHTWRADTADSRIAVVFAELMSRPAHLGGDRVAALLFTAATKPHRLSGRLCVFDADGPYDRPLWLAPDKHDWPAPPRPPAPQDTTYRTNDGLIADIFPALPGEEIAVTINQNNSPSLVRVYDLGGTVLYEAWHRGSIGNPVWLSDSGLLLLSGCDNRFRTLADYRDKGEDLFPIVIFALKPVTSQPSTFINPDGMPIQNHSEWSRWLHSASDAPPLMGCTLKQGNIGSAENGSTFHCDCRFVDAPDCTWVLDDRGSVVRREASSIFLERFPDDTPDFVVFTTEPPMHRLRLRREDE